MKKRMRNVVLATTLGLSFNATASGLSDMETQTLFDSLSVGDQVQIAGLSQPEMAQTHGKLLGLLLTIAGIAAADSAIVQGMMSDYADATKEKDEADEGEQTLSDIYAKPSSNGVIYLDSKEMDRIFYERASKLPSDTSGCDTYCEQHSGM